MLKFVLDIMKCLLSGKDKTKAGSLHVETRDSKGRTAFHLACIYGHYDVAKTLLEVGEANPMVTQN